MRILSGIQPSGSPHIGNYFGYIKPCISLQDEGDVTLMIADLHALTTVRDPALLRQYRTAVALDLLACGLDPEKSTLFFQSDVPAHTELAWLLSCVTPMGMLERAVSYKDKVQRGIDASMGLFTYPVLQAADILLYQADTVPVGKDQKQHVEMARDIAQKFHHVYGDGVFVIPEPRIQPEVAVVLGIDGQKMSKSYGNTIPLFGDDAVIKKAIMGIVTDSKGVEEPKDPDDSIIFKLHSLFLTEDEAQSLATDYRSGGLGYGEAKKKLYEVTTTYFADMRRKRAEFEKKPEQVRAILTEGAAKAAKMANTTLMRAKEAVGIL